MTQVAIVMFALFAGMAAYAEGVRVSFLNEAEPLRDTLSILSIHGCPSNALAAFEKAVRHYYSVPFTLDRSRFPEPTDGSYAFKSLESFAKALPGRLCDVEHPYEVNCFVPVLLLSGVKTTAKPDDLIGPLLAIVNQGGQSWDTCTVATPRDAFHASYGPQYARVVEAITGQPWTDQQICLMASLHACHVLPRSTTGSTLPQSLLGILHSRWSQEGVSFPTNTVVTMLHSADLSKRFRALTDHAGFLVPLQNGYMYIEKAGGQGPFLRIDVRTPENLIPYYRSFITPESKGEMTHWAMTLNDTRAYLIEPEESDMKTGYPRHNHRVLSGIMRMKLPLMFSVALNIFLLAYLFSRHPLWWNNLRYRLIRKPDFASIQAVVEEIKASSDISEFFVLGNLEPVDPWHAILCLTIRIPRRNGEGDARDRFLAEIEKRSGLPCSLLGMIYDYQTQRLDGFRVCIGHRRCGSPIQPKAGQSSPRDSSKAVDGQTI